MMGPTPQEQWGQEIEAGVDQQMQGGTARQATHVVQSTSSITIATGLRSRWQGTMQHSGRVASSAATQVQQQEQQGSRAHQVCRPPAPHSPLHTPRSSTPTTIIPTHPPAVVVGQLGLGEASSHLHLPTVKPGGSHQGALEVGATAVTCPHHHHCHCHQEDKARIKAATLPAVHQLV